MPVAIYGRLVGYMVWQTFLAASVAVGSSLVKAREVAGHSLALYIPTHVMKDSGMTHVISETLNPSWCFQCRALVGNWHQHDGRV